MKGTPAPLHRSTKAGSSGLVTLRGVFPPCGRVSETPSVPGQDLEVNNQVPPTLSRSRRQRGFSLWAGPAGIAVQARHGTALSRQKNTGAAAHGHCCTRLNARLRRMAGAFPTPVLSVKGIFIPRKRVPRITKVPTTYGQHFYFVHTQPVAESRVDPTSCGEAPF